MEENEPTLESFATYNKYLKLRDFLLTGQRSIVECADLMKVSRRTAHRFIRVLKSDPAFRKRIVGRSAVYYLENDSHGAVDAVVDNLEKILKLSSGSAAESRLVEPLKQMVESLKKKEGCYQPESYSVDSDLYVDFGFFTNCDFNENSEKYDRYLNAIKHHKKIKVVYRHSSTETDERMTLMPLKLVMRIDTLYLWAAYEEGGELKDWLFVFDQIRRASFTEETFEPPQLKAEDIYRYAFAKWRPDLAVHPVERIVLEAETPWASSLFARAKFQSLKQGEVVNKDDVSKPTLLIMNLSVTPDFKAWLFGMLDSVKILEPASLKAEAKAYLEKALRNLE